MLTRLNNAGRFEPARLFRPERVAVLGGPAAVTVTRTLLAGQFHGAVLPVADAASVGGVLAYRSVADLPVVPDLAVVCEGADPATVFPALAARGCFAAIVVGPERRESSGTLRRLAEQTGVRSLGPGSFGLAVPAIGLDATLGHRPIRAGRAALVSQSGATCRAVLDWAGPNGVGFSHVVGIGDNDDVGFALVLDWLSRDRGTGAILLDIHRLKDARAFLSAARAAARLRPVVALQSGFRRADPSGAQEVAFRAALARAGVLSVDLLDDLLSAAETLARAKPASISRNRWLSKTSVPRSSNTRRLIPRPPSVRSSRPPSASTCLVERTTWVSKWRSHTMPPRPSSNTRTPAGTAVSETPDNGLPNGCASHANTRPIAEQRSSMRPA